MWVGIHLFWDAIFMLVWSRGLLGQLIASKLLLRIRYVCLRTFIGGCVVLKNGLTLTQPVGWFRSTSSRFCRSLSRMPYDFPLLHADTHYPFAVVARLSIATCLPPCSAPLARSRRACCRLPPHRTPPVLMVLTPPELEPGVRPPPWRASPTPTATMVAFLWGPRRC